MRKSDGRLILRDTAQTPAEEMDFFTDEHRHPFFHTNNLWFDLEKMAAVLEERGGIMGLPLIRNEKTVDPADKTSTPVYQIESAMGAAIEVFDGATAIVVGRDRFLPVKATSDLLLVRSDAYALDQRSALVQQIDDAARRCRCTGRLLQAHPGLRAALPRRSAFAQGGREPRRAGGLDLRCRCHRDR